MRIKEVLNRKKQFINTLIQNMFLDLVDIAQENELDTLLIEIHRSGRLSIDFNIEDTKRLEQDKILTKKALALAHLFLQNYEQNHDFKDAIIEHFDNIGQGHESEFKIELSHLEKSAREFCGDEIFCLVEQDILSKKINNPILLNNKKGMKI